MDIKDITIELTDIEQVKHLKKLLKKMYDDREALLQLEAANQRIRGEKG